MEILWNDYGKEKMEEWDRKLKVKARAKFSL